MFRYVFALFLLLFFRYAQYDVLAYIMSSMVGHYMKPWPWTVAIVLTLLLVLVGHGAELVLKKRTIHHRLPYVVVGYECSLRKYLLSDRVVNCCRCSSRRNDVDG